jgi:hypothetical protein
VDLLNPDKEICNDGTSWVQAAKNTLGSDGREACLVLRYTYYSSNILVWVTRFETPEHIKAAWVRSEGYQSTSSPAPEIGEEARIYRRGGLHNNFAFRRGIYLVDVEGVSAPVERLRQLAELLDRNLLRLQELRLQEIRPVLHQVEERLKPVLVQLTPKPTVEYEEHSEAVVVRYLTRGFQVHTRSKTGDWSTNTVETVGPDSKGFILQVYLQRAGEVNQVQTPQRLRAPYWRTLLDVTLMAGTTNQIFWGLSYGSRTDEKLLRNLREALGSLGCTTNVGSRSGIVEPGQRRDFYEAPQMAPRKALLPDVWSISP